MLDTAGIAREIQARARPEHDRARPFPHTRAPMPRLRPVPSLCLAAVVALGGALAPGAAAQIREPEALSRTQFGFGYVGNAPDAILGGMAYVLTPSLGGFGIYVDAKFDRTSPSGERGYEPRYTAARLANEVEGANYVKTEESWRSFNVAIMRSLTPSFMAYVGGGLAKATWYDLYNVPLTTPVGFGGTAWVEDPDAAETRANLMFGIMMRVTSRVTAQFGYETKPDGVTAGASLRLPAW